MALLSYGHNYPNPDFPREPKGKHISSVRKLPGHPFTRVQGDSASQGRNQLYFVNLDKLLI